MTTKSLGDAATGACTMFWLIAGIASHDPWAYVLAGCFFALVLWRASGSESEDER